MSTIKGGDLMFFTGGKSICFATSHKLSVKADTKETSSKDSGGKWQTSEVGILSWNGSSENLYADTGSGVTYDELFGMMIARTAIDGVFALEGDSTDLSAGKLDTVPTEGWKPKAKQYKGKVYITSLEVNAPNGDNATFTVEFTGTGALTAVTGA